ncbi:MAG: DegV family EDD domain-containing protein [Opitutaceae bacterium]|nr:DegV family EDD domain-containing protein [Opitutaceae bacterium]
MSWRRLSVDGLRWALRAGIGRVVAQRDELDRINVSPVPDRDTGTNLSSMLGAVLPALHRRPPADVASLFQAVATEAADAARGNAGSILAHYLHGLAASLPVGQPVTLPVLAQALATGVTEARLTLADPREGTVLSVMQAFADAMQAQVAQGEERWGPALRHALTVTQVALHRTKDQIKALQAAGVVDAGARGFVALIEGINDLLEQGRRAVKATPGLAPAVPAVEVIAGKGAVGPDRFRLACTVRAPMVDRPALRAALRELGAPRILLAGSRAQVRLQAEVDAPVAFFATAARFGELVGQETETLAGVDSRRTEVAIVTDSGADIPADEVERLGIHVVPQRLSLDGREHVDGVTITPPEFYAAMREHGAVPRTSQPPPGDFRRMFGALLTRHEQVVEVSLSRQLSGTMQSAINAAVRSDRRRVQVYDSGQVAAGQGLMVIWAAEAARAGMTAPRLLDALDGMRERTRVYAIVRDIAYGVRGGRIPKAALPVTRLLRLCLILCSKQGRLGFHGVLGAWGNLPEKFARRVARTMDPRRRYRVIIGHGDCAADAARVQRAIEAAGKVLDRVWVVETGVAIGAHAGPGSLVIAVQEYEVPSPC